MLAPGVLVDLEKVEAEMRLEETECQSSRYVVLGIGWVVLETREWIEVVHSGQDRRISPTGHVLHGWGGPDHRERD